MTISDRAVIIRGGLSELPERGTPFSGSFGASLEEAAAAVPHGMIRATTAGAIRQSGGSVIHVPEEAYPGGPMNQNHVTVTEGQGQSAFSDVFPNPIPKPNRIAGRPQLR